MATRRADPSAALPAAVSRLVRHGSDSVAIDDLLGALAVRSSARAAVRASLERARLTRPGNVAGVRKRLENSK